jgi:hypothetical protein
MPSPELERLVTAGLLEREPPIRSEFKGLRAQAASTLADAQNSELSQESRFALAYNAVHAIALAALRWHGYRPRNRQVVFQALAHTLQTPPAVWRTLSRNHDARNRFEYEGLIDIDERLLQECDSSRYRSAGTSRKAAFAGGSEMSSNS